MNGLERERLRQQSLMQALQVGDGDALQGWVGLDGAHAERGLQAYRANAGASAERTLASAFPTVQALVGEESFAALSRALWHAQPPQRGDLACFGEGLPGFIEASEQLADVPYLADVARLDWLLALAERASNDEADLSSLNLLADTDPAQLRVVLAPGAAVLSSAHPIVSLWAGHRPGEGQAERFDAAKAALREGRAEAAFVWRQGWRAQAQVLDAPAARWTRALIDGRDLARALDAAGESFGFEAWLGHALAQAQVMRVQRIG